MEESAETEAKEPTEIAMETTADDQLNEGETSEGRLCDTETMGPDTSSSQCVIGMESVISASEKNQQMIQEHIDQLMKADMDPFDEDQAELRFLYSKPTCFIVLGKPGSGKTSLARRLAQEWKCQMVGATEVIQEALALQTELGVKAQEILLRGEAVPEDMAAKLIEDKINSPEVAHHGYVLDGFPSLCEDFISFGDQLELVKNWKLTPDFIINMRMPDKDLENRRVGQRVDSSNGEIYTKEVYDPDKTALPVEEAGDGEEEEEEEEEEMEESEELGDIGGLPSEVMNRLIRRPEDLPNHVAENISSYKGNALRILEDYMADHDQQYLVELDANKPTHTLHKELMTRLACFSVRPAAVPIRLQDPEDEDLPEEMDTDELIRLLAAKQMVAPRFRWRRSRWLRYCPVALTEGNLTLGKPEYGVSFLDKIYVLSSDEAMAKFLKNPRPYLLPPQPRPPCKLMVVGPPLSGKTTLCEMLGQKYAARVLDMDELSKQDFAQEKESQIEKVKQEATESAIITIRSKLREKLEAEMLQRAEMADSGTSEETTEETDKEDEAKVSDSKESDEDSDKTKEAKSDAEHTESSETVEGSELKDDETVAPSEAAVTDATSFEEQRVAIDQALNEVDDTHPEVVSMVNDAVESATKKEVTLTPQVYAEILQRSIEETEREMRKTFPDGPLYGGWIVDNFPRNKEQWTAMIDADIVPDDVIVLKDESENGDYLLNRWYNLNQKEVDQKIIARQEEERAEKARKEAEAERERIEQLQQQEEELKREKEEEHQRRLEAGDIPEEDGETEADVTQEDDSQQEGDSELKADDTSTVQSATPDVTAEAPEAETSDSDTLSSIPSKEKLPACPEFEPQKELLKSWHTEWISSQSILTSNTAVEPFEVRICIKTDDEPPSYESVSEDDMLKDVVQQSEGKLQYQSWEQQGADIDEDEEDGEADEEAEEEEGEEEEDPNRSSKKHLGDVNYYCPVALKENFVLWPGNPELAVKYREKLYYFSSQEAQAKFLAEPSVYLPRDEPFKPPPVRVFMLGARGSGKSVNARHLAKKLGLFHIQFRERLQELVIAKTKKKIGPEYEEDEEEEIPEEDEEEEDEDEEDAAIVGPDGSKVEMSGVPVENEASGSSVTSDRPAKTEEEEDEEEEEAYTEDEEAIMAYLKEDEALPNELLDKIVQPWWQEEPFRSTGFILEGFPRTTDEVEYLSETGLFPDTALFLSVEDSDIIGRLLPPKMDKWCKKRDRKLARRQKIKDKKKKKRDEKIEKRRQELMKEAEERKAERRAEKAEMMGGSDDEEEEEEEEEEEDDIEAILEEEFEEEEEEEEEDEETEEDAHDRMTNALEEVYDNDTNRLAAIQEKLEEILVPRAEIDAGRKPHIVRYLIKKRLRSVVEFHHSIFERVYSITEKQALKMMIPGYKQLSRFGRWCPVNLAEGDCIQPMSGHGYPTYPAIYRQHIYFLSSAQAREQFSQDPYTFLSQPRPKPVVPIKVAIIGPPKSGKTTLAARFVAEFGMMRLSIGEAIRMVLDTQPKSELCRHINSHLTRGLTVPDDLYVAALDVALMDVRCQTRGYVLDGFPVNKNQVDLMTARSIIPVRVIELKVASREIVNRATKDRYSEVKPYIKHDSPQILAIRLAAWQEQVGAVRDWYREQHSNLMEVEGETSKWNVWNKANDISRSSVKQIQTYLQRISEGKAASVADMCITPHEFESRLGDYGQYCPVALAERNELVDCSVTKCLKLGVEYRGYYYKTSSATDLESFLEDPEKYVPPQAPRKLPPKELLPIRRTHAEAAKMGKEIELLGYCPVTFLDGYLRYEAIVPGDPEMVVEYREKLYNMESEDKLQKFMRLPEKYWNLKLPHKLPPRKDPLNITSLPMLGFMEQTVASLLTQSLTAVGNFKPKYPFLTPTRSALVYVAYYLKAYNPRSSEYIRKKYKRKLAEYEDTCKLISYLGDTMTKRYKEPQDRPIEFDFKLETFIQLKDKEPTTTWVA